MQSHKDSIPLLEDFAFEIFNIDVPKQLDNNNPMLHFHDCLELNYVVDGSGVNVIEDKRLDMLPGDLFVINNIERHIAIPNPNLILKVIIFDPLLVWNKDDTDYSYLKPFFNRNILFSNKINANTTLTIELVEIINKMEREWNEKLEGYKIIIKALLMELLALLYRHFKLESALGNDVKTFHKSYYRLKPALDFINKNFTNELTLQKLSEVCLMNRTYFSTFFKKVMQVNVWDYIENLRISHARLLLKTTNLSVTDICFDCGFKSVSHFSRVFKAHCKVSPIEYRNTSPK